MKRERKNHLQDTVTYGWNRSCHCYYIERSRTVKINGHGNLIVISSVISNDVIYFAPERFCIYAKVSVRLSVSVCFVVSTRNSNFHGVSCQFSVVQ